MTLHRPSLLEIPHFWWPPRNRINTRLSPLSSHEEAKHPKLFPPFVYSLFKEKSNSQTKINSWDDKAESE